MLQHSSDHIIAFEVFLYNRDVRAAVKENRSHDLFGDHWADVQIQDVMAESEDQARRLISDRYPPDQGFVVQQLSVVTH
jgi:hypothetical protein